MIASAQILKAADAALLRAGIRGCPPSCKIGRTVPKARMWPS